MHGHTVAIGDIRDGEPVGAGGLAVLCDVTDPGSVAAAVRTVERQLGPVEILVNNAGWDEMRPFIETDEPFWDRVIEVNFKGGLRLTRAVLPGMVERGCGRIVNIGSDAGRVGSSLESVYSGAKGGVIAFTKTIAREVARGGVTANTVCPGPTDTPMLREVTGGDGGREGDRRDDARGPDEAARRRRRTSRRRSRSSPPTRRASSPGRR